MVSNLSYSVPFLLDFSPISSSSKHHDRDEKRVLELHWTISTHLLF